MQDCLLLVFSGLQRTASFGYIGAALSNLFASLNDLG